MKLKCFSPISEMFESYKKKVFMHYVFKNQNLFLKGLSDKDLSKHFPVPPSLMNC